MYDIHMTSHLVYALPEILLVTYIVGDALSEKLFRALTSKKGRHHA